MTTRNETKDRYLSLRREYIALDEAILNETDEARREALVQRLDDLAGPLETAHRLVTGETEIDLW